MSTDRIEPKSWIRSSWFTWSWLIVLGLVVLQSLTFHCRLLPTSASGYFTRGRADYYEGNYEEAIKNLSKSIELDAKDAESYIWRGESFVKLHAYDKGKADLLKAKELRGSYAKSHAALGDYHAAVWDGDAAIGEFTVAIEQDPKYGRSYLERGQLHFDAGRWDEAAADFQKASTLLDDDQQALAYTLRFLARVRGGDTAGATAELMSVAAAGGVAARWFGTAVDFFRGDTSEPDFIARMAGSRQLDEDKLRIEAYFLAGEKRLTDGDRAGALALLREVIRSDIEESYAFDRARVELQKRFAGFEPMRLDGGSLTIVSVSPGGPAEAAGITAGSTLKAIDDEPADREMFLEFLGMLNPGLTVKLSIVGADGALRMAPLEIPLTLETFAPTK